MCVAGGVLCSNQTCKYGFFALDNQTMARTLIMHHRGLFLTIYLRNISRMYNYLIPRTFVGGQLLLPVAYLPRLFTSLNVIQKGEAAEVDLRSSLADQLLGVVVCLESC